MDNGKTKKNTEYDEKNREYKINYKLKANKNCNIYLASDNNLQLYIDGNPQFKDYANIWSTETGIKQIKHLEENEQFEFTLTTKHNLELLYIYVSDNNEIQKLLDSKRKNYFTDIRINNDGITGKAIFDDDGFLVFSIAYNDCWKIWVDGKEVPTEVIGGCFLGIGLKKGKHEIVSKVSRIP